MSITVGIDFGTHQTKVCINYGSNADKSRFEFLEFYDNIKNKRTLLLPSIIQINNDNLINYGFVDQSICKSEENFKAVEPSLIITDKPKKITPPPKPNKVSYPLKPKKTRKNRSVLNDLKDLKKIKNDELDDQFSEIDVWEQRKLEIDIEYDQKIKKWKKDCDDLKEHYNKKLIEWETHKIHKEKNYSENLDKYNKSKIQELHFRYFKLDSFYTIKDSKEKIIGCDILSTLYLTNLFFLIREKVKTDDFFIQMGFPGGVGIKSNEKERIAYRILYAANELYEKYGIKDEFLSQDYKILVKEIKELLDLDAKESDVNFALVIPEALAGLYSISKKLVNGIKILVDIGGGTTDVALFTSVEGSPDIHNIVSFPKGLNFIFEKYKNNNSSFHNINEVQNYFFKNSSEFESFIKIYQSELNNEIDKIIKEIEEKFKFNQDKHGFDISTLRNAFRNKPVVYSGGGSIYQSMRTTLLNYFTEIKVVGREAFTHQTFFNENIDNDLYTILATSYGLSIPQIEKPKLTPSEKLFNHISRNELNRGLGGYDHGLTQT